MGKKNIPDIEVITEPKVTVVGMMGFEPHPDYPLPMNRPVEEDPLTYLGAFAAKGCYDSFGVDGRSCEDNQRAIIGLGHGSVLEHLYITLFIEGISRGLSIELNRHRHLAISQRSTRYTEEGEAAIVLDPYYAGLSNDYGPRSDFVAACEAALQAYSKQVEYLMGENPHSLEGFDLRKWARGKAKNLLPHALETRATYTGNIRCWRHIIETRSSRHAEAEIRRLMMYIYEALSSVAPLYFEDYTQEVVLGLPEFVTENRKV